MIDGKNVPRSLTMEIIKNKARSSFLATGIVSVQDFSPERVVLATHNGKIVIVGKALVLSVFEGRSVMVTGKIMGVEL